MKEYLKQLLKYFNRYKASMLIITISMLVLLILNFILPFESKKLMDEGIIQKNSGNVINTCIIILIINLVILFVTIIKNKYSFKMHLKIKAELETNAFNHLLNTKMNYFSNHNSTSTYDTLREDIDEISSIFNKQTVSAVTSVFSAIGGAIALFVLNWKLAVLVMLSTPVSIILSEIFAKKCRAIISYTISIKRKYTNWFGESISGIKVIKLFGLKEKKLKEMQEQIEEITKSSLRFQMISTYNVEIQLLLVEVLKIFIYIFAVFLIIKNELTIGSLIAFQTYMLMVAGAEATIVDLFFSFYTLAPHIKRYFDFMNEEEENYENGKHNVKPGKIVYKDVCFSYDGEKQIFNHMNLEIPLGSKVAIVGGNGIGKTTLLNLMLRLFEPDKGEIFIDDVNIKDYNVNTYRTMFSVVSQDIFLFNDSIKNNICLGKNVNNDELNSILNVINLNSLTEEAGMDYIVGENGASLSGGQKQKIALARAIIQNRPIVIFDEATSNLDSKSVRMFLNIIKNKMNDATVLCVTHSNEISSLFNTKILLEEGKAYYQNQ